RLLCPWPPRCCHIDDGKHAASSEDQQIHAPGSGRVWRLPCLQPLWPNDRISPHEWNCPARQPREIRVTANGCRSMHSYAALSMGGPEECGCEPCLNFAA